MTWLDLHPTESKGVMEMGMMVARPEGGSP
jgi:hypothetical protein